MALQLTLRHCSPLSVTLMQPEMFRDDNWGQFNDNASIQSSSTCVQRLRCTILSILHDWNNTLSPATSKLLNHNVKFTEIPFILIKDTVASSLVQLR